MRHTMMIMAGAAALAGCASLVTGGDLVRPGEPTIQFTFQNTSGQVIDTVLISTCDAASYGLDRLPNGVAVGPGQSYTWTISPGCYDVMAGAVGVGSTPGKRIQVPSGRPTTLTYDGRN